MISATVSGHFGRDAEVRAAGSTQVVSFSIASSGFRNKEKVTDWVRVSWFGSRAEKVAQYLTKGMPVVVRGDMFIREYESKGEKKTSLEMRADDVELMGSKSGERSTSSGGGGGGSRRQAPKSVDTPADDFGGAGGDDNIPFISCDVALMGTERWWR